MRSELSIFYFSSFKIVFSVYDVYSAGKSLKVGTAKIPLFDEDGYAKALGGRDNSWDVVQGFAMWRLSSRCAPGKRKFVRVADVWWSRSDSCREARKIFEGKHMESYFDSDKDSYCFSWKRNIWKEDWWKWIGSIDVRLARSKKRKRWAKSSFLAII